ncbi:5392_t:CDS:2 [Dentiscutata erythropus]|uniref:5392_t:CDS:1 n=1 Tax=Dentiscutata erythropus TaxID=1348616 RepID=A0A9N9J8D3_9GLOM|nr:5392_t:CDS:2 [Dentiscutata erythropus]
MKRCWDSDPSRRPKAQELFNHFNMKYYEICSGEYIIPYSETICLPSNVNSIDNRKSEILEDLFVDYVQKSDELFILTLKTTEDDLTNSIINRDDYSKNILSGLNMSSNDSLMMASEDDLSPIISCDEVPPSYG